jgi:hypothetical protein
MKKFYLLILAFILFVLVIKSPILTLFGITPKKIYIYKTYNDPLFCEPQVFKVKKTSKESIQIENQNLRKWNVTLLDNKTGEEYQSFLVTKGEDLPTIGSLVLMATNCTNFDMQYYKENSENPLLNIYLYIKDNKQIELKTGKVIDNNKILLNITK